MLKHPACAKPERIFIIRHLSGVYVVPKKYLRLIGELYLLIPFWAHKITFGYFLEGNPVECELPVVGLPCVMVVFGVEAPEGLLPVNHRPSETSYLMIGVEVGQVVAMAEAELPVFLPEIFLKEKAVSLEPLHIPLVAPGLGIHKPGSYGVRPFICFRFLICK